MKRHLTRMAVVVFAAAIGCSKPAIEPSAKSSAPVVEDSAVVESRAPNEADSVELVAEPQNDTAGDAFSENSQPELSSPAVMEGEAELDAIADSQEQAFGVFRSLGRAFLRGAASASGSAGDEALDNSQFDSSGIPEVDPTR